LSTTGRANRIFLENVLKRTLRTVCIDRTPLYWPHSCRFDRYGFVSDRLRAGVATDDGEPEKNGKQSTRSSDDGTPTDAQRLPPDQMRDGRTTGPIEI